MSDVKLYRAYATELSPEYQGDDPLVVLASDYAALQAKHDKALALLSTIMEEADVYEPTNDGTRNWCPELSIYLRGNYVLMVTLTPEEYETLKRIANPKE